MINDCVIGFPKGEVVSCCFWDDECVIYHKATGETHLIDGMGAEVFKLISDKTATRTQLLQNIHSIFELDTDFDLEGVLDNLILEYQNLGLLEVTENNPA